MGKHQKFSKYYDHDCRCKDSRYKTCSRLSLYKYFYSTFTGKKYNIFNPRKTNSNCKFNKCAKVLVFNMLEKQHLALNKRINIHRTSKNECYYMISHFKE